MMRADEKFGYCRVQMSAVRLLALAAVESIDPQKASLYSSDQLFSSLSNDHAPGTHMGKELCMFTWQILIRYWGISRYTKCCIVQLLQYML
jgi:hypothetical protein